jgi:predicted amidohydrolase YtcJ
LHAAGITRDTPDPAGGAIDRGDDGEPTGVLRDNAALLVQRAVPKPDEAQREADVRTAIENAHRLGVTCVHAMDVGRGEWLALRRLHERGELTLRVRAFLSARHLDEWTDGGLRTGDGDEMLRVGGVKFFTDGALGSTTAWMFEPYEGTDSTGIALQSVEDLEHGVRRALEAGLAPAVHAIGDRANHEALGVFERTREVAPELPRRIEHAQLLRADDVARFARLGVTASVQPIHATADMHMADRLWGGRCSGAYAYRSLLHVGVNLAFGSDSPVETIDPLAGIHAAVTRRDAKGEPGSGWHPEQRVGLDAAFGAYTLGCARAVRDDGRFGRIAPGYAGDLVVLSHDVFAFDDPMRILDARVETTVVGGRVVYRGEAPPER